MGNTPDKKLNKEQLKAVTNKKGPLLIIAGAGTGKTTVISERIKYLISEEIVKPSEILALTFTEKAAQEMQERVDVAMPYGYTQMWISTFHSFCDRILRREALHIGFDPRFKLNTEAESIQFIRRNLFKFDLDYFRPLGNPTKFIGGMLQHFSRLQDEDITPNQYNDWLNTKLSNAIQTLKVGAMGTHNCLGLAKAKGARILVASTSEVYGDPLVHPQTEEYWGNVNPVSPRGVYDEAKRYMESITMAYHTFHQLETRIARIFNTYGPRMRLNDGRALPAFIGQAICGEDLTVFGDGSQTRSFCYVDDLVEGIYRLLMSDYIYPVNLGNPDEITTMEFANEIIKLTGSKQKIIHKPLPQDDPKQRQPETGNFASAHYTLGL